MHAEAGRDGGGNVETTADHHNLKMGALNHSILEPQFEPSERPPIPTTVG